MRVDSPSQLARRIWDALGWTEEGQRWMGFTEAQDEYTGTTFRTEQTNGHVKAEKKGHEENMKERNSH